MLILGLDHAGKTVRALHVGTRGWVWMDADADPWTGLTSRHVDRMQTLLEQSKGIFRKIQGLPPDKITPTVGLNGA